jgi:nickel-dependent lactate racemase
MLVDLPYGKEFAHIDVPERSRILKPNRLPLAEDVPAEIKRSLDHPIGTAPLRELAKGRPDAVVVINDHTRPAASQSMLEGVVAELESAGIGRDLITVVIATGSHRPSTEEEIRRMVGGDLAGSLRFVNHRAFDEDGLTYMGDTESGQPIWLNTEFAKASLKILTGLINPHQCAGFSGGRKSVMPGIAGFKALVRHHSFPIMPREPAYGWLKGNIFHEEALAVAQAVGVDFILNLVQNSNGQVVKAFCGDLVGAHEAGTDFYTKNCLIELDHRYDVVVVTCGGYPRDQDLYQAQKAMGLAESATEKGAVIVLVAECSLGTGRFAENLKQADTPYAVIERFEKEGFNDGELGKAFMFARAVHRHTVIVSCSGIGAKDLEDIFCRGAISPQDALEQALAIKGKEASVLVVPYAVDCLLRIKR